MESSAAPSSAGASAMTTTGASGGARSPDVPRAGDSVQRASTDRGRSPDEDGGTGGVPVQTTGAAGASGVSGRPATTCAGGICECSTDADCVARGVSGGTCVDGQCWEPPEQCQADADCTALGPEYMGGRCQDKLCQPNPRWRCEPPAPASSTETRELTLPLIDALQLSPVANVPVMACNKLDYTCMQPMAMATSGMDGKAKLTVPANFAGYMQQIERNDYVPAMYFMPALLPADGVLSNFPLVPAAAFSGLAIALGTQTNRERGHAMLIVEDCKGVALAGIKFTSPQADAMTTEFYVRDQIPTTSAKDTPPEGDGGFANLPAGVAEITATEVKTGLVINTVTMLIRAGSITTAYIRPASRGTIQTGRNPLSPP